jgi:hypothetical protein
MPDSAHQLCPRTCLSILLSTLIPTTETIYFVVRFRFPDSSQTGNSVAVHPGIVHNESRL